MTQKERMSPKTGVYRTYYSHAAVYISPNKTAIDLDSADIIDLFLVDFTVFIRKVSQADRNACTRIREECKKYGY